ncbi:serine-rich adhesin for platelets-like [Octopus vulgaris]|uniref:Serine-rich adhesin for platelets-like n=1 Tax=Octopus vulgaris TaxID=6645 RepID=A0AA36BCT5_OCTVU|nr:serine-rich adhesin for platelets-like [Octopus vulgaris]
MHSNILHQLFVLTTGFLHVTAFVCPPGVFNSLIPDPNNCKRYFHCLSGGRYYSKSCPPELRFDPRHKICNWPALVPCQNSKVDSEYLQFEDNRNVLDPFDIRPYKSNSFQDENEELLPFSSNDVLQRTNGGVSKDDNQLGAEFSGDVDTDTFSSLKGNQQDEGVVQKSTVKCESAFGFMSDPYNCDIFYHCYMWVPFPKICPKGLFFDHFTFVCNWPRMVNCVQGKREMTFDQIKVKRKSKYRQKQSKVQNLPMEIKNNEITYWNNENNLADDKLKTKLSESNSFKERKYPKMVKKTKIINNPYTQFKAPKISNHNIRPTTRTKPRENIKTFTPTSWNVVRSTKEIADQNSDTTKLAEIEIHGQESERLQKEITKSSTNLHGVNDIIFLDMKDVINDEEEVRNSSPNQSTESLYENHLNKRERSSGNDSGNETTIQNVKVTKQLSENQDKLWQFGDTEETKTGNSYTTVLPGNKKNSKMYFSPKTTIDYGIKNVEDDKENVLPSGNLYSTSDELLQKTKESILLDRIDKTYPPNLPNQTELLSSLIAKDIIRWEQRTKTKSNAVKSNNGNDSESSTGAQANTDHRNVSDDHRFISGNTTDARVSSELFPLISNQTQKEIEDVQTLTSCNDTDLNCKIYNESNALLVNSSLSENTYLPNINNTIDNNGIIGGLKSHSSYGNSETTTHVSGIVKDHSNKIINSLKDSKQTSIVTENSSEIVLNPNLSNHLQFDKSLKMSSNSNGAITKEIFSKYYTHLEDNLTTNTPVFKSNDSENILKKNPTHYISRNSLKHDIKDSHSESNSLVKSLLEQRNRLDQSLNQQRKSSSLNYNDGNKLYSYKNDFHPTTSKIGFRENAKNTVRNELPMLLLPRENNSKERKYKQLFPESGGLNYQNVGSGDTKRENYFRDNKSFEKNLVNSNPVRNLQTNAKSVLSTNILKQLFTANQNYNQLPTQISLIFPENDNPVEDDDNNNNYINDFMSSNDYPMPYNNRNLTKAVSISIQGGNLSTKSISEAELQDSGDFVLQINDTKQSINDDELEENNATGIIHHNNILRK